MPNALRRGALSPWGHASITVAAHTYADLFDDELDEIATTPDSLDEFHEGGS